jgi:hypothetical protein
MVSAAIAAANTTRYTHLLARDPDVVSLMRNGRVEVERRCLPLEREEVERVQNIEGEGRAWPLNGCGKPTSTK